MRMRKIYQLLYEKAGSAELKITDIAPAKATTVGHTNKAIGFWWAMAEMKEPGAKIDGVQRVIGELWDVCDGLAVQLSSATRRCQASNASLSRRTTSASA